MIPSLYLCLHLHLYMYTCVYLRMHLSMSICRSLWICFCIKSAALSGSISMSRYLYIYLPTEPAKLSTIDLSFSIYLSPDLFICLSIPQSVCIAHAHTQTSIHACIDARMPAHVYNCMFFMRREREKERKRRRQRKREEKQRQILSSCPASVRTLV